MDLVEDHELVLMVREVELRLRDPPKSMATAGLSVSRDSRAPWIRL
jgi:hypothetical protein